MNATARLLAALLARGEYLETLTRAELRAILPILEAAHDEVLGKIAKTNGEYTRVWLAEMAADLDAIYGAAADRAYGTIEQDLEELAISEGAWLGDELSGITIGLSLTAPAPSLLKPVLSLPTNVGGSTLEQLFEALGANSREAAYTAIAAGVVQGETVDQLTRRLRGAVVKRASWRKDSDGVRRYVPGVYEGGALEGVSTRQAEVLARTAIMHVANEAREIVYRENADLFKGYERVETLDGDTCLPCGAEDGRIYGPDEPRPALPAHPGCRGLYLPVLKSWKELGIAAEELPEGTRASMDGQVPESETYADRLAKMSGPARRALLGPSRASLYEQGVSLADMVRDGRLIPLAELGAAKKGRAA